MSADHDGSPHAQPAVANRDDGGDDLPALLSDSGSGDAMMRRSSVHAKRLPTALTPRFPVCVAFLSSLCRQCWPELGGDETHKRELESSCSQLQQILSLPAPAEAQVERDQMHVASQDSVQSSLPTALVGSVASANVMHIGPTHSSSTDIDSMPRRIILFTLAHSSGAGQP